MPRTASRAQRKVTVVIPAAADSDTLRGLPAASCRISTKFTPGVTRAIQCSTAMVRKVVSMG